MKNQNNSQRLPGICAGSPRCECLAFLSLGLSGLVIIGFALFNSARFSGAQDQIVTSLTTPYVIAKSPAPKIEGTNIAARHNEPANRPS
jgi:hypothetical protein